TYRIAALDHEVGNHPMKDCAIVEFVLRFGTRGGMRPLLVALSQINEVFYGDRCIGFEKANLDAAFGGLGCRVGSGCDCHRNSCELEFSKPDFEQVRDPD